MPRQPYLKVIPPPASRGSLVNISPKAFDDYPIVNEQMLLIGRCLTAWPFVESEMALALGELLGASSAPVALAVFQSLRRSSAQREAISEAARVALDDKDRELLNAILNVHKSVEAERNALAHGHFGISSKIKDGVLWGTASDFVKIRLGIKAKPQHEWKDKEHLEFLSNFWVYKGDDLKKILADIHELGDIWFNFTRYLSLDPRRPQDAFAADTRDDLYHLLCDRPRIDQELETLRREKTPPTQPEPPTPNQTSKP